METNVGLMVESFFFVSCLGVEGGEWECWNMKVIFGDGMAGIGEGLMRGA